MSASDWSGDDDTPLRIGDWTADPRADELRRDGRTVKIEPLRMRLLMALARRPGQVVLSNELLDTVWKGAIVTPSSLYQTVAQLRQHLGDDPTAPTYIETVPRKGYRLIAPVARDAVQPASDAAARPAESTAAMAPARPAIAEAASRTTPAVALNRRLLLGASALVAAAGAASLWWTRRPAPASRRIAVLPLADVSATGADDMLVRGLTADLNRALTLHPGLEVISQDAVLRLAPRADSAREAGRLLAADLVLQGDLSRDGNGVRATFRLIEQPSGQRGDDMTVDASVDRLSQLPPQVAQRVITALGLAPLPRPAPTVAAQAYELYLRGIEELRAKTPDSVANGRRLLTQAIDADPQFPRSYAALASAWILQWEVGGARVDRDEAFARAEQLYAKALQLDPQLVEARLGLANTAREFRRYDEARRAYEAVMREAPSSIQAYFGMALVEENDGWPTRAIGYYQRAAQLDPTHFLIPLRGGLALLYAGRLAEAQASFERSIALDVTRPYGHNCLGILNWVRGELAASFKAHGQALQRGADLSNIWDDFAFVCLDAGLHAEAQRAFDRITALQKAPSAASVSSAYVWLAAGAAPPAPTVLAQRLYSPAPWERLWILALAGQPVQADDLKILEDAGAPSPSRLYEVVSGHYNQLNRATLYAAAGRRETADALLAEVERALLQYQERGVTAPALDFHRARVAALRGDGKAAVDHLKRAVDGGWRRAWWTRRDPAFAALAGDATFAALLGQMEGAAEAQRRRLSA